MNDHANLVEALTKSNLFHDFQKAFSETTGLPVSFQPIESWHLPLHGRRNESGFCGLMAKQSHACAQCLQLRQKLCDSPTSEPRTMECGFGMSETAVPVHAADKLIGFLHTGQVFQSKPAAAEFDRTVKLADKLGIEVDVAELKEAYFGTQVVSSEQYGACVSLLAIFSEQLAIMAEQILTQERLAEPPVITRAKRFIADNYKEDISLDQVAKFCNTSTFYFCKLFKRATGVNFTEYVSSVRIEKAKNLLLNPNLKVSDIGYEVGFQSLTHFNRVFKKLVEEAPSEYRDRLPDPAIRERLAA